MPMRLRNNARLLYALPALGIAGLCAASAWAQEPIAVIVPAPKTSVVKSIFFTQEDIAALHQALEIYSLNVADQAPVSEGEDFLKQLEGKLEKPTAQEAPKKYYTYPQFFMQSLAYHGPEDWIIEVNGLTFTAQSLTQASKTLGKLQLVDIDKDKASLKWMPPQLDMFKIAANNKESHDPRVDFDRINDTIIFTLHANQTFSPYAMRVLEGKVQPVTVSMGAKENRATFAPDKTLIPPSAQNAGIAPMTPAHNESRTGLSGLIGSYNQLGKDHNP